MRDEKDRLFSVTAADCDWDYYVGSGKGGQKRNKTANCVRCTHRQSGAVACSEDGRSQLKNKQAAFRKMAQSERFQRWLKAETYKKLGVEEEIRAEVERSMRPGNLLCEAKVGGKWVKI